MGVNLGDIWVDADDIYGAGVNVAARLEGLAQPGTLCISEAAYQAVNHKVAARYEPLGPQTLKNVAQPINAWRVRAIEVPDTAAPRNRTWLGARLALAAGAAAAAIAAAAVALWIWSPNDSTDAQPLSIAVLPLVNLSGDLEQEYFVDGMTEALITSLSKLGSLNVISRTSVMRYKGNDKLLPEIAAELGVTTIVEGSAQLVGDQVRITAQLIDARSDRHLWADCIRPRLRRCLGSAERNRAAHRERGSGHRDSRGTATARGAPGEPGHVSRVFARHHH